MNEEKTICEQLNYLFSKINWGSSFLDAQAITIMNTIGSKIDMLEAEALGLERVKACDTCKYLPCSEHDI